MVRNRKVRKLVGKFFKERGGLLSEKNVESALLDYSNHKSVTGKEVISKPFLHTVLRTFLFQRKSKSEVVRKACNHAMHYAFTYVSTTIM